MGSRSDIQAGRAYVELYVKGRSRFERVLGDVQRKVSAFGSQMMSTARGVAGLSVSMLAPLGASLKAASDMEEVMNKFNVVFGESSEEVKKWGDNLAGEVGRSKRQIAEFLAEGQDLLVPIGFDAESAEAMSKQLTTLAVDLASFNNMADANVMRDLKAAMTGSGEVMKKYGVIVSAAAVKQEMLNQGLDPGAATEQQKAMARMAIILRGTTAAQGDALRSAGSFANVMKALKGATEDAAGEVGKALLPTVASLGQKTIEGRSRGWEVRGRKPWTR